MSDRTSLVRELLVRQSQQSVWDDRTWVMVNTEFRGSIYIQVLLANWMFFTCWATKMLNYISSASHFELQMDAINRYRLQQYFKVIFLQAPEYMLHTCSPPRDDIWLLFIISAKFPRSRWVNWGCSHLSVTFMIHMSDNIYCFYFQVSWAKCNRPTQLKNHM